jgi:hypothetical protein
VKFADSIQGWRRKWVYVKYESTDAQEYGLAPLDASGDIQRLQSWDAEASAEEKAATDSPEKILCGRIRVLRIPTGSLPSFL